MDTTSGTGSGNARTSIGDSETNVPADSLLFLRTLQAAWCFKQTSTANRSIQFSGANGQQYSQQVAGIVPDSGYWR